MKGELIVKLMSFRSEMLKVLHSSHLGAQKCLGKSMSDLSGIQVIETEGRGH
jgi:hypothetical protein